MLNFLIFSLVAFVVYVIVLFRESPWKVHIDVSPQGGPQISGPLSETQRVRIEYFLQRDLEIDERLKIFAAKEPSGRLLMRIDGQVDPGQRQQIRNFLSEVL